ncbi:hypothetical protein JXL19_09235 [bacterium]|nr:hypothetical protein [bacterium]
MAKEYSVNICKMLEEEFRKSALHRPIHVKRYDAGDELVYDVTGMPKSRKSQVRLIVEKFVGGGFAGQVYRVKLLDIKPESGSIEGLNKDGVYAIKILIPPSTFSVLFRNMLYWIGFQGPFQLQVNPEAIRAGSLWQKFIRRGAKIRFGDERTVVDIYGTFIDNTIGSCGELREWIEGRTWILEADDRMDLLRQWKKGKDVDISSLGSPEYRAKRDFMNRFVCLLHEMGCPEFARQYEWSTCKSQPNCLKREDIEPVCCDGLTAVDFRAGLALLPLLPMSPGDFKLIASGFMRGSLVQFDRGDTGRLEKFVDNHKNDFDDMQPELAELKESERLYRDSLPDITHNHIRLLYSRRLWSTIINSSITGWRIRNFIDDRYKEKLQNNKPLSLLFFITGIIPFLGSFLKKIWAHSDWRRHYFAMLTSWDYLKRATRAKASEMLIDWHRSGRIDDRHTIKAIKDFWRFLCHLPLSILPAGLHRALTDWKYAKGLFVYLAIRPIQLYFKADLREQWLSEMVTDGKKKHLLNDEDADVILSHINEPFIQKYLKSLAVHLCTLPVTQMVSVTVAIIFVLMHPEMPRGQAWGIGIGIIALFQVVPISPGSLVRGIYVLYLVIKDRNFRDYNIAIFLGFFKYIGYLAFPIQMTYRYPALARFMAGHWATEAVHIVPVFGERGALLEHGVFSVFYNWPLTIRRRMRKRTEIRTLMRPRYWHIVPCSVVAAGILGFVDFFYFKNFGALPGLKQIWWIAAPVSLFCGSAATLFSGGSAIGKRIIGAAISGCLAGFFYTALSSILAMFYPIGYGNLAISGAWRIFIFTFLAVIGAILTELTLPEPSTETLMDLRFIKNHENTQKGFSDENTDTKHHAALLQNEEPKIEI